MKIEDMKKAFDAVEGMFDLAAEASSFDSVKVFDEVPFASLVTDTVKYGTASITQNTVEGWALGFCEYIVDFGDSQMSIAHLGGKKYKVTDTWDTERLMMLKLETV